MYHVYFFEILQTEKSRRISPKVTKITTVTPLRSENLDILMKREIVGEVKIGPYSNDWRRGATIPPDNVKVQGPPPQTLQFQMLIFPSSQ